MSISKGNFLSNFRFNNVTGALNPSDITDERQFVKEFEEFPSYFGFTLIETPRTDIMGITEVKRISDGQIFTHTSLSSIGTTEYFFDYTNEIPNVFFHASNLDEEFAIKYKGIGAAANAKNLLDISLLGLEMSRGLSSKFKRANAFDKIINGTNVYLLGKRATMRNCLVQGYNIIRGNVDGLTSFFEVYGDLTLERGSVIDTAGVIFIVHGSLKVTGIGSGGITYALIRTIDGDLGPAGTSGKVGVSEYINPGYGQNPDGGNGGNGTTKLLEAPAGYNFGGGGGGGGGGGSCGWILSGIGGAAGSPNGSPGTAGVNSGDLIVPGAAGSGGAAGAGGNGNRLYGHGQNGVAGANGSVYYNPPYIVSNGGDGGRGGDSGGACIFLIVFGEIDPMIVFTLGQGANNGITIVSNYASIPNTINNAKYVEYLQHDRSDINEHLLTEYGYFNAGSISI